MLGGIRLSAAIRNQSPEADTIRAEFEAMRALGPPSSRKAAVPESKAAVPESKPPAAPAATTDAEYNEQLRLLGGRCACPYGCLLR